MMKRIAGEHVAQDRGLILVGGKTRGGPDGDVISEFHVDVTRVNGDQGHRNQRDWIVNRRLKERHIVSVFLGKTGKERE